MNTRIYPDKVDLIEAFSHYLIQLIADKLNTPLGYKEGFHWALSGGSTPVALFDFLADRYKDDVDWDSVYFYWGDERCVPPSDPQSNYLMTVTHFLSKIRHNPDRVYRIRGEENPIEEANRYHKLLTTRPVMDLMMLGLGEDGHTASIFPHQIELFHSDALAVAATHTNGQPRISMTGNMITNANQTIFLVSGSSKAAVVAQIANNTPESKAYPASLVSDAIWFMDADAGSLL
jgi:6-phosphogluconolactonase